MNSIEREKLLKLATEEGEGNFRSFEPEQATYYLSYSECRHIQPMAVYDSTELKNTRDSLMNLWENEQVKRKCIPIFLSALRKASMEPEKQLPDIDLYNYMM